VIERASKLTLEEYLYVLHGLNHFFSESEKVTQEYIYIFSKENIFDPLGIKLSFYSTPDLLEKLVALTIRREGKVELFDPNIRVAERDPEKGTSPFPRLKHKQLED